MGKHADVTHKPWEMTCQEAIEAHNRRRGMPLGLRDPGTDSVARGHREIVMQALREGEAVPAQVLANYPDLRDEPMEVLRMKMSQDEEAKSE